MNPISSFKEMSTGKKVAVVAGTAAVAAGVGLTTAALLRGRNINLAKNCDLNVGDTISWKVAENKEGMKFFEKLTEGFKSIFKGDARKAYKDTTQTEIAKKALNALFVDGKVENELCDNVKSSEKFIKKLAKMVRKNDNTKVTEDFTKKIDTVLEGLKAKAKAKAPKKTEAPAEAPAVQEAPVEAPAAETQA